MTVDQTLVSRVLLALVPVMAPVMAPVMVPVMAPAFAPVIAPVIAPARSLPPVPATLTSDPAQDDSHDLREQAATQWAAGEREASIDLLTRALATTPDDIALRRQLAEQQLAVHRYEAALETARPGGDALRPIIAQALVVLDRFEEALPLLDPTDPGQAMARVAALEILGRADEAASALDAMEDLPGADHVGIQRARGRLHAVAGDYAAAARCFEAVLAVDPDDTGALFGLGQAWVRLGRREEGLELLARHRELAPLIDQLDFAQRAVDLAPRHASSHALVGDAERALHHTDRALQAYQLAARLATPDQLAPIALRLARLLEDDLQQVDDALAVLDGAAAGGGGPEPDARLIVRAGDLLVRAGRWMEAVARYEQALALRPRDGAIRQRLETARAGLEASEAATSESDR